MFWGATFITNVMIIIPVVSDKCLRAPSLSIVIFLTSFFNMSRSCVTNYCRPAKKALDKGGEKKDEGAQGQVQGQDGSGPEEEDHASHSPTLLSPLSFSSETPHL